MPRALSDKGAQSLFAHREEREDDQRDHSPNGDLSSSWLAQKRTLLEPTVEHASEMPDDKTETMRSDGPQDAAGLLVVGDAGDDNVDPDRLCLYSPSSPSQPSAQTASQTVSVAALRKRLSQIESRFDRLSDLTSWY